MRRRRLIRWKNFPHGDNANSNPCGTAPAQLRSSLRNAGKTAGTTRPFPDGFAVVVLIVDNLHVADTFHQFGTDLHVTDLIGREHGPPFPI